MEDVREFTVLITDGSPWIDADTIEKIIESRLILARQLTSTVHVVERLGRS